MGKLLTAEDILQAKDLPQERVAVPEWGGDVLVRTLTGAERDAFERAMIGVDGKPKEDLENFRARMVALTLVDEAGKRLFAPSQVLLLGAKSARALERVYRVARRLSGLTNEDVDELVKNSAGDPSDASGSD